jgi:hypothetical protein
MLHYCKAENLSVTVVLYLCAAGANWRQLTETDKIPYEKLAEVERRKYESAMREYNQVCCKSPQKL